MNSTKPSVPVDPIAHRSPQGERDKALSAFARSWSEALSVRFRCHALCALYPRVANRLALCWPDWALTERLLADLLVDKRGGRQGFPPEVAAELVELRRFSAQRASPDQLELLRWPGPQDLKWADHLLSPSDR